METRKHVHREEFATDPEKVFALLHTPSAICGWWGASRAVVIAKAGGTWAASWGDEDSPDYVSTFEISVFDPPRRMVFTNSKYQAKDSTLPFEANFTTEFTVEKTDSGAILQVAQDGFPCDPVADDFYAACDTGWRNTFAGIRKFLEK